MHPQISVRGSVRPSVGWSVCWLVLLWSFSRFFQSQKLTNQKNLTSLTNLQIWQIWHFSLQFYLSPLLQTHLFLTNLLLSVSIILMATICFWRTVSNLRSMTIGAPTMAIRSYSSTNQSKGKEKVERVGGQVVSWVVCLEGERVLPLQHHHLHCSATLTPSPFSLTGKVLC